MGNRAVIQFQNNNTTAVYLHWSGGPESVLAFIHAASQLGARTPQHDQTYAMAGLVYAITLFMYSGVSPELLSVGVGPVSELDTDNGDNGVYIVGGDWQIERRSYSGPMTVDQLSASDKNKYRHIRQSIIDAANAARAAVQ